MATDASPDAGIALLGLGITGLGITGLGITGLGIMGTGMPHPMRRLSSK